MKLYIPQSPKSIKRAACMSELNEICRAQTYQTWTDLFFSPTQRAHCSDAAEYIHTAVIISAWRGTDDGSECPLRSLVMLKQTGAVVVVPGQRRTPSRDVALKSDSLKSLCHSFRLHVMTGVEPWRCQAVDHSQSHKPLQWGDLVRVSSITEWSCNVSCVWYQRQLVFLQVFTHSCSSGGHIEAGRPSSAGFYLVLVRASIILSARS